MLRLAKCLERCRKTDAIITRVEDQLRITLISKQ